MAAVALANWVHDDLLDRSTAGWQWALVVVAVGVLGELHLLRRVLELRS